VRLLTKSSSNRGAANNNMEKSEHHMFLSTNESNLQQQQQQIKPPQSVKTRSKKTKGRVKIKMEFIENKIRRYTTFSKRKTGIMKKVAYNIIKKNLYNTTLKLAQIR
jgi:transposase